jgi:phosphopantetheinyl transferase
MALANSSDRFLLRSTGRALAEQLLIALGGTGWTIEPDMRGKPVVSGPLTRHVSIAHSRSIVVAAASAVGPIGIDIEYLDAARDLDRLASAAYGAEERRVVASQGVSAFYRIWTVREAISKATGDGMALVADRLDRVPASMRDGPFISADGDWLIAHDVVEQNFSLALAVQVASRQKRHRLEGLSVKGALWRP